MNVGLSVGIELGRWDLAVGSSVGVGGEGVAVGKAVVGRRVGDTVGEIVGAVTAYVGVSVGDRVGAVEGWCVGRGVGALRE